MTTPTPDRLTEAQVVPFLLSVIASGERLTKQDVDDIRAALATHPEPGEDWIDHLPGITQVGNVHFDELMVPVSKVREHFRALRGIG